MMINVMHGHHLQPLSSVDSTYEVDPIRDLRPVCPNCHAVSYRREPPYSLDDVLAFLDQQKNAIQMLPEIDIVHSATPLGLIQRVATFRFTMNCGRYSQNTV